MARVADVNCRAAAIRPTAACHGLATVYGEARRRADETRIAVFSSWVPGVLRVDVPTAVDVYAALCNIDVYTTLTVERGWPPDRVEAWWAEGAGA